MDLKLRAFPRVRIIFFLLVFLAILAAGAYGAYYFGKPVYEKYADSQGQPCSDLPDAALAKSTFSENGDAARQVGLIAGGADRVSLDTSRCPGKGEVAIYYSTWEQRNQVKDLLGGSFHGVPYHLYNS